MEEGYYNRASKWHYYAHNLTTIAALAGLIDLRTPIRVRSC